MTVTITPFAPISDSYTTTTAKFDFAGVHAGDLLLVVISGLTLGNPTPPSGWTLYFELTSGGGHIHEKLYLYYAIASSSEPSGYTFDIHVSGKGATFGLLLSPSFSEASLTRYTFVTGQHTPDDTFATIAITAVSNQVLVFVGFGLGSVGSAFSNNRLAPYDSNVLCIWTASFVGGKAEVSAATETTGNYKFYGMAILVIGPASAPSTPTLLDPINGTYTSSADVNPFKATYNSTNGQSASGYVMRFKQSSASTYSFWNATSGTMQSTQVINSCSVAPSANLSLTIPSSLTALGHTYNWSMAFREPIGTLLGSYATNFVFTVQSLPGLTVTGPTGTVTTARPRVTWTTTPASTTSIIYYQVVVFTEGETEIEGFTPFTSPNTWNSDKTSGSATTIQIGTTLANNTTYIAYVTVWETGTERSTWQYTTFTTAYDSPVAPTVTSEATTTPTTGAPIVNITVTPHTNIMSKTTSVPKTGVGTWVATTNCTITHGTPPVTAPSGPDVGLKITPSAAGTASVRTKTGITGYVVTGGKPYTLFASFLAVTTPRACAIRAHWYKSTGTLIATTTSGSVTDSKTVWEPVVWHITPPTTAKYACMLLLVNTTGNDADIHWAANLSIQPGDIPYWGMGGFIGNVRALVRSITATTVLVGFPTNTKTVTNNAPVVITDHTVPNSGERRYRARLTTTSGTLVSSAWSTTTEVTVKASKWWFYDLTSNFSCSAHRAQNISLVYGVTGGHVSFTETQNVDSGYFKAFGRSTYIKVEGTIMTPEFTLILMFLTATEWDKFYKLWKYNQKTGHPIFVKSDMTADVYWVNFGPARPLVTLRGTTRTTTPVRQLIIHCYPTTAKTGT